jgi:hypothetical protein
LLARHEHALDRIRIRGPAPARVHAPRPERLRAGGRRAPCEPRRGGDGRRRGPRPARLRRPREASERRQA